MNNFALRSLVAVAVLVLLPAACFAGGASSNGSALPASSSGSSTNAGPSTSTSATTVTTSPSPSPNLPGAVNDPLLNLLITKGLLTSAEANHLTGAALPEVRKNLLLLLHDKGILSDGDLTALNVSVVSATEAAASATTATITQTAKAPAAPAVIAAVAPVRVLQVDPPKREGLIPDIKLGSGARLKPYGFFKTSIVHDTSSPYGNDFPLPGFIGNINSSTKFPEFHIKARALRVGTNFEWVDLAPKLTLTGRLEIDFEGNFSRVNNRNISTIRSSAPQIRLGWTRLDYAANDKSTVFALFGQDWTPFGSSTLPNLLESTGLGLAFGTLYERAPQARFGVNWKTGGPRNLTFQPEIAVVLPAFGNLPADLTTNAAGTTPGSVVAVPAANSEGIGNQLGYGERQGTDSGRPEIQARIVMQWQLDKAKGVAPAQLIFSGMQGSRTAEVLASAVPAAFQAAFPTGATLDTSRHGYTAELQLPTRWVTLTTKYYNGSDLRFYFAGQLFSEFNDVTGLTGTANAQTIDGASTVVFGLRGGVPVLAAQQAPRSQGGFVNLGFPLSRIFNAEAAGRNAGWTLYAHYGYDQVLARDVRRLGGGRQKGDLFSGQLQYKLNPFVTFAYEQSLYRTRALPNAAGAFPLFQGKQTREQNDIRSEFGTIFTF